MHDKKLFQFEETLWKNVEPAVSVTGFFVK